MKLEYVWGLVFASVGLVALTYLAGQLLGG
jgi:hypothetical protein